MKDKKRKRGFFNLFDEMDEFMKGFEPETGSGSGYSISVTYDEYGRPIVDVKTYGEVDKKALKKELEKSYPGAKIKGLEEKPLIEEINEDEES